MERTFAQRLAGILHALVIVLLACNIVTLFFVPGLTALISNGGITVSDHGRFVWRGG